MKKILFLFAFIFTLSNTYAQPYKTIKTFKPYDWMIGVSWTVIDDDGKQFTGLFDVPNSWNFLYYPTKLSLDKYFKYGWSMEVSATYESYLPGKLINGHTDVSGLFLAADVNGKYSFYNKYAPKMRWFEPYFTFGVGYTLRTAGTESIHAPTINLGYGMNFWIYKGFGIQLHSNAKIGVLPMIWTSNTNYLQHSAGLVYRWKKGSRNKGDFDKRRYPWTRKNERYKEKSGH